MPAHGRHCVRGKWLGGLGYDACEEVGYNAGRGYDHVHGDGKTCPSRRRLGNGNEDEGFSHVNGSVQIFGNGLRANV